MATRQERQIVKHEVAGLIVAGKIGVLGLRKAVNFMF